MNEPARTVPWRHDATTIALHWLLAALIAAMAGLGWWMMTVEHEPGGRRWIDLHVSVGLIVALLVLFRLGWRLTHRAAPLPPGLPAWQRRLAHGLQGLLYVLMVLVPATGLLGAAHRRAGLAFFGMELPRLVEASRETAKTFFARHELLVWLLVALVALHVLAALKHRLLDRDGVFERMQPGRPRR